MKGSSSATSKMGPFFSSRHKLSPVICIVGITVRCTQSDIALL